jgi:hypothetical protein
MQQLREGSVCFTPGGRFHCGLVGCLCRSPRGAKKHQRARVQKQLQVSSCATRSDEAQEFFFEDLKQGSMFVNEYVTRFTQLSRYALDNMDTDEKKQDWFLNGLNDGLAYALEAHNLTNFQDMVDKALVLENRRGIMERKRKM